MALASELKAGVRVSWNTAQGRTRGVVVRKATSPQKIKSFQVHATRTDPRVVVKSDVSGELAAHKPSALRVLRRA